MGLEDIFGFLGNNFGGLLQAGTSGYAYKELMDQTDVNRKGMLGEGGRFDQIRGDVSGAGSFQPWGVTNSYGSTQYGADGQMTNQLSGMGQQQQRQMQQGSQEMFGRAGTNAFAGQAQSFFDRAAQDPAQREQDIYNRTREMQRPGEERQQSQMTSNLFGSGRGGMGSGQYGASPEEHGFNMARNEAMNQASFQSMGQAQQEMQNYQNMGSNLYGMGQQNQQMYGQLGNQMYQNQFMPEQMMQQYGQMGMGAAGQQQQSGQNMAGLLAQLGLGEATTDVNYSNVQGSAFASLAEALGMAASGIKIPE